MNLNHHIRDNLLFMVISFIAFNQIPTMARAQEYEYSPVEFAGAIKSTRGNISPLYEGSVYLTDEDACHVLTTQMGWAEEGCQSIEKYIFTVTPDVDSVIIEKPNSDGYVKFDDWDKEDKEDEIEAIWDEIVLGLEAQSERLGKNITADRWHVYPTLNKNEQVMYYATLINWDGEPTLNINASAFDRSGYITFRIIPNESTLSPADTQRVVNEVLSMYSAEEEQKYTQFITGDKVAAVGAIGVLATLVGVKYGKEAAVGILAVILAFVKKAWFLLLLPFVYLKKLFKRDKND